jgi:hypothetical protein
MKVEESSSVVAWQAIDRAPSASLADMLAGVRFLARIPAMLRRPVTVAESRAILRRRLEGRPADFLALARNGIYARPESPYRQLLVLAGCEYGDLARLVTRDGLEEALRILYGEGVYLTLDEFKGRRPTVRSGRVIEVTPDRCRNARMAADVLTQTSGSRGPRTSTPTSLAFVRSGAVNKCLSLDARGGAWRLAHWDVPGGAITSILSYSMGGTPAERWFSPFDLADPGLHPRYRWSARAMRWGSVLAGRPLPWPEHVPVDDPSPVAHWMVDVLRQGGAPLLVAYTSPVVRLCQAARDAGVDLRGARFSLYGEPFTEARLTIIRGAGADAFPVYATSESGRIGDGCLAPPVTDDVHLLNDLHALIQPGADGARPGLPSDALLLTSLRSVAPLILLNVSMGDRAVLSDHACGCALERLGWTTHLHSIRSYEKLTASGMTFPDTDVIRILETVLPARFGGAPTDYQLVERDDPDSAPRVVLRVHPRLGPLPPEEVAGAFLASIGAGSGVERVMSKVWRDASVLRVEREAPVATASGKILHLHVGPAERP